MRIYGFLTLTLFCLVLPVQANESAAHQFYFSRTVMRQSLDGSKLEIEMRFFTDDLELAISDDGEPFRLGSDRERSDTKFRIEDYLRQHFIVYINDQFTDYRFWGKEVDYDITYCFLELTLPPDVFVVQIQNTVLMDVYPEQVNEVEFIMMQSTRRLTLNYQWPVQTIQF
jgi:hypothetical protein